MAYNNLDAVDISILSNLQNNGRMTNVELANRAGISAPPCLRRLKNLEDRGIIVGYHAEINGAVIGYGFVALCLISIGQQNLRASNEFLSHIKKLDNIRECFSTTGDFDYILKIVAHDLIDYENFLNANIKNLDNISQVKTYVVVQSNKSENGVPIK